MDLSQIVPGSTYFTGQVFIANPVPGRPTGYQSCRIRLADGWVFIELNEADGEGSVDVYPASQIAGIVNLYEPQGAGSRPRSDDARPAGSHFIATPPSAGR